MPRILISIFLISLSMLTAGCVISDEKRESLNQSSEDEFSRLTSCVGGGLPMEIQFVVQDNPTLISGDKIDLEAIDKVIRELDFQIASLLNDSMVRAWELTSEKHKIGSKAFINQLQIEFSGEIVERAPKKMNLEFCGNTNSVGGAVFASTAGYFSRATRLQGGSNPVWLKKLGPSGQNKGTTIVMLAVGMRLAGKDFDPDHLAVAVASEDR